MDETLAVVKKKKRAGTRARCATCRTQRQNGEEINPNCFRCLETARSYGSLVEKGFRIFQLHPPKSAGTTLEQRGFDLFHRCTAPSLSGLIPCEFWHTTILQKSSDLPCLRHAVIAIGTVHECFMASSTTNDPAYTFALKQYNLSIRELQKSMKSGECTPEVALICCALYVSFDSLRGMTSSAITHLQHGIKILQGLEAGQEGERNGTSASFLELRRIMCRLASQINSDMQDLVDTDVSRDDEVAILADCFGRLLQLHPVAPAHTFTSLEDARDHLYSFINAHLYHYYLRSLEYGSNGHSVLRESIHALRQPILDSLNSWAPTFEDFLATNRSKMSPRDLRAATLLQMHFQVSYILIVSQLVTDEHGQTARNTEDVFKQWTNKFAEALFLIEFLVLEAPSESSPQHPTFYIDCGVVPMLFFIAMKCRDPRLRRKATDILRLTHRREGTWDSETCVRIIDYALALEGTESDPVVSTSPGLLSNESGSPGSADSQTPMQDEKAKRYIDTGRLESQRLQGLSREQIKHSLLYI